MMNDAEADPQSPEPGPDPEGRLVEQSVGKLVARFLVLLLISLAIAFGVRSVAVEAYLIPSESMVPTLQVNDRILVAKTLVDFNGINQGDLVVFSPPPAAPPGTPDVLIKRVVAVGGDTIEAHSGSVYVNGVMLDEPYVSSTTSTFPPVQLGAEELFLMGDNRQNSTDSRRYGPVPESHVIGSAFERIWPLNHFGGLD